MDSSDSVSRLKALIVNDPMDSGNRSDEAHSARLRLSLQMSDDGIEMKRASLRRLHPDFNEQQIQLELAAWLAESEPPGWDGEWTVLNPARFAI